MLDGGNEIILANWPNDKHIICTINNNLPIEIPGHPYVLVNRSNMIRVSMCGNHYRKPLHFFINFHYLYTLFYYFYQLYVYIRVLFSYLEFYKCNIRGFTAVFIQERSESE